MDNPIVDPLVMAVGLGLLLLVFSYITAKIWQDGQQRIEQIEAGVNIPERKEGGCLAVLVVALLLMAAMIIAGGR